MASTRLSQPYYPQTHPPHRAFLTLSSPDPHFRKPLCEWRELFCDTFSYIFLPPSRCLYHIVPSLPPFLPRQLIFVSHPQYPSRNDRNSNTIGKDPQAKLNPSSAKSSPHETVMSKLSQSYIAITHRIANQTQISEVGWQECFRSAIFALLSQQVGMDCGVVTGFR